MIAQVFYTITRISVVYLVFAFPLMGQDRHETLTATSNIDRELKAGDVHIYDLELKAEQFFLATLNQIGIDIVIIVKEPSGKVVGTFDSPNGINGPEFIQLNTESEGTYTLEVKPLGEVEEFDPGRYTLHINKLEELASKNEGRIVQMMSVWDNPDSPGASISVIKEGKIIFSRGFGSANLEYSIPIESNTIFHIASISKQFTAFAIAMLADQGKISLDEDIRTYLPYVPDFGKTITVRHLAHHTSGMRDQWNLLAMAGWRLDDVITKDHVIKLVSNQKELNFDPGSEHLYCNTGYTLMADIVESVTGQSFADWTDEHIFRPLGMKHTLFYDDHEKIVKNRAYSYQSGSDGYKKSVLSYANAGATSLFTTVEDLCMWAWNFEDIKVGNPSVMAQMQRRGVLTNGDTISYAFGQVISDYKGLPTVVHGGADAGYRTFLVRFPDQDLAVAVFSNLASFNPGDIAFRTAELYLGDFLPKDDESESDVSEEVVKVVAEELVITPEKLESYVGRYELFPGFILSVSLDEEQLIGQATGQPPVVLQAVSTDSFFVAEANAHIKFGKNEEGQISQLTLYQGGGRMVAPRMEEFDPSLVDFSAYSGEFVSEELGASYRFEVMEEKLKVVHQRLEDFELTPVKEDTFSGNRWFFGQVVFIKDQNGKVTGCKVSSGRVRNVHFDKVPDDPLLGELKK